MSHTKFKNDIVKEFWDAYLDWRNGSKTKAEEKMKKSKIKEMKVVDALFFPDDFAKIQKKYPKKHIAIVINDGKIMIYNKEKQASK